MKIKKMPTSTFTSNTLMIALSFGLIACSGNYATAGEAKALTTLKSVKASDKVDVITLGSTRIHTFYGISNSHIIETPNEVRVIDAQMMLTHAKSLKKYVDSLGKPVKAVILSHNHPDHWFGAEVFAADGIPVIASENTIADLNKGGARYIKIMKKKLKDNMPKSVIKPDATLTLGKHNWDGLEVVVEEYTEHESHHSILIKIPAYGVMMGQDLFYNDMFLVASERERNKNWVHILKNFMNKEAEHYKTILVGHGKNTDTSVFQQDIEYLDVLESTLKKGLSQEETQKAMIAKYPKRGGKGLLTISMKNLFKGH